jgi:hypothetical protein
LFIWPVYQSDPSLAASGSCGREPGVDACQNFIETLVGPGTITASGLPFTGKVLTKYALSGSS